MCHHDSCFRCIDRNTALDPAARLSAVDCFCIAGIYSHAACCNRSCCHRGIGRAVRDHIDGFGYIFDVRVSDDTGFSLAVKVHSADCGIHADCSGSCADIYQLDCTEIHVSFYGNILCLHDVAGKRCLHIGIDQKDRRIYSNTDCAACCRYRDHSDSGSILCSRTAAIVVGFGTCNVLIGFRVVGFNIIFRKSAVIALFSHTGNFIKLCLRVFLT